MTATKQKILQSSIQLFNSYGIDAVRLQQIAEDSGISVGNLAYHYKNKEAIVDSVYQELFTEFASVLSQYSVSSELKSFDLQLESYFYFFEKYQFYIADFIKNDSIKNEHSRLWQEYITKMLLQIKSRISLLELNNHFIHEPIPGLYFHLAENIWVNLIFYFQKSRMKGVSPNIIQYKTAIWNQIKIYFSDFGVSEFTSEFLPQFTY